MAAPYIGLCGGDTGKAFCGRQAILLPSCGGCAHQIHRTAEKPAIRFISAPTRLSAYLRREPPELAALKFLVTGNTEMAERGDPPKFECYALSEDKPAAKPNP